MTLLMLVAAALVLLTCGTVLFSVGRMAGVLDKTQRQVEWLVEQKQVEIGVKRAENP